ncbi:Isoamyl acetate-hydrolyzing esterase 1-like protein [Smittium mucronatum]|uniref:Isoamyl acetate-hydrolyzing esterase 1-like protein n=1 Tax=Smittium mucronatum TaxID=133383 RepID=A0A1R0GTP2_9FUNG|nr:Isoamyl acetate-hydrolyzing esterase 1-like protein [Smittium mucronatum]
MKTFRGYMLDSIVVFGDNITELGNDVNTGGWVSQLSNLYIRKLDVINRGFSGYNSTHGSLLISEFLPNTKETTERPRNVFDSDVIYSNEKDFTTRVNEEIGADIPENSSVRLVIIFYGAIDASFPGTPSHVPLEEYQRNLLKMVDLLRNPKSKKFSPKTRILLVSPPPISDVMLKKASAEIGKDCTFSNESTKKYSEAAVEFGNKYGIPTINTWDQFMLEISNLRSKKFSSPKLGDISDQSYIDGSYGFDLLFLDGFHLTNYGNQKLFNLIVKKIIDDFPELDINAIPLFLPDWKSLKPFKI